MRVFIFLALVISATANAQQIFSRAQLDAILGDQVLLEDFEGVSIPGGTSVNAPNPLNSDTQPPFWGLESGVTYSSPYWLGLYTAFMNGDDSNVLAGSDEVMIVFHEPQQAVGFDIVNISGNISYFDTVTFYSGTTELASIPFTLPSASDSFVGWQNMLSGITAVRITEAQDSFGWAIVDNVEWGLPAAACTPDLNRDGTLNFFDVQVFLELFAQNDPRVDLTHDGIFDFFDVQTFLQAFATGCG